MWSQWSWRWWVEWGNKKNPDGFAQTVYLYFHLGFGVVLLEQKPVNDADWISTNASLLRCENWPGLQRRGRLGWWRTKQFHHWGIEPFWRETRIFLQFPVFFNTWCYLSILAHTVMFLVPGKVAQSRIFFSVSVLSTFCKNCTFHFPFIRSHLFQTFFCPYALFPLAPRKGLLIFGGLQTNRLHPSPLRGCKNKPDSLYSILRWSVLQISMRCACS